MIQSVRAIDALAGVAVATVFGSTACRPTFESQGTVTIDGTAFAPKDCRVLAPRATGVALGDSTGRWLTLALPPMTLKAWRQIDGTPSAALTRPGQPDVELGPCGVLTLRGEGYHGEGKRAASGNAALECSAAGAEVKGVLSFTGCF